MWTASALFVALLMENDNNSHYMSWLLPCLSQLFSNYLFSILNYIFLNNNIYFCKFLNYITIWARLLSTRNAYCHVTSFREFRAMQDFQITIDF